MDTPSSWSDRAAGRPPPGRAPAHWTSDVVGHDREDDDESEASVGELLKELRDETGQLVRQQVQLIQTEVTEKVTAATKRVTEIYLGSSVIYAGAFFLLLAGTGGLVKACQAMGIPGQAVWLAPLVMGVLVTIVGLLMTRNAIHGLRGEDSPVPHKTITSLKENKEWLANKAPN